MANYRGQDGSLILGGKLVGSPLTVGSLTTGVATMTIDATTLTGIVAVGDLFTIPNETGTPTHTVTGSTFRVVSTNTVSAITFTPAIVTVVVADNSTVTFTNNTTAELTAWGMDASLEVIDTTKKGDTHRLFKGGIATWSGTATALLDYLDTEQASLIDEIATGSPDGTIAALMFEIESGKQWYGSVELSNFVVNSPEGSSLVDVAFTFQGSGAVLPDWN